MLQKILLLTVLCTLLAGGAMAAPQMVPDCGLCGCPDASCLGCHTYCNSNLARLRRAGAVQAAAHRAQPQSANNSASEMLVLASTLPIGLGLALTALRRRLRKSPTA